MKNILSILGSILIIIIFIIVVFIGCTLFQGRNLDATSREYVETNIPPIVSTWSSDELRMRSSPQLLRTMDAQPEQIGQLFKTLSRLGAMKSLGDIKGESNISLSIQYGKVVTAIYTGSAKFLNGDAMISVRLIQSPEGKWQFLDFHVNSPLFIQEAH